MRIDQFKGEPITVEKGVPLPEPLQYKLHQYRGGSGETNFTTALRTMEVGESFLVSRDRRSLSGSLQRIGKASGKQYTMRLQETGEYRVWRKN